MMRAEGKTPSVVVTLQVAAPLQSKVEPPELEPPELEPPELEPPELEPPELEPPELELVPESEQAIAATKAKPRTRLWKFCCIMGGIHRRRFVCGVAPSGP
jgi:hypothetical protein